MSQAKILRDEFAKMNPYDQGWVVYLQGGVNDEIPNRNPYKKGTDDYDAFESGKRAAHEMSKTVLM